MTKLSQKIIALALVTAVGATSLGLISCKPENDPNTLNIIVLDKGYGKQWIETLKAKFESENEGVTVNLTATPNAKAAIDTNLSKRDNIDDLYISTGIDWRVHAAQGKLAPLDDLYEETVDNVKIKDKLNSSFKDSIFAVRLGETSAYRLPWTGGVGGIMYNVDMFNEYGWTIPQTYEELRDVTCPEILAENLEISLDETVKPFVYTGDESYYWDYLVFSWWGQIAGREALADFFKYNDKELFDVSKAKGSTYNALKQAYSMWYELIVQNPQNVMSGCTGKSYLTAQSEFAAGKAAMIPNGQWLYNEMKDLVNFEMALLPTPKVSQDSSYVNYLVGEDESIVIPASSIKKDLAKKFVKLMVSDFGCNTFLEQANGLLGFDCTYDSNDQKYSLFQKSIIEASYGTDVQTFTHNSTSKLYTTQQVNVWAKNGQNDYKNAVNNYNATNPAASDNTPDKFFASIATHVNANWATWLTNAGL